MLVIDWLYWIFSDSGIVCVGPMSPSALRIYSDKVKSYNCSQCGVLIWARKPVKVCRKFSCFRKNGGWR